MRRATVFLLLSSLIFQAACSSEQQARYKTTISDSRAGEVSSAEAVSSADLASDNIAASPAAPQQVNTTAKGADQKIALTRAGAAQTPALVAERKIIRQAEIVLETETPSDGQRKIALIAEETGGYMVTSDVKHYGGELTNMKENTLITMTLRVPPAQFASAIERIRETGKRIISEKTTGQDVTEEYIDLEGRLRSKVALEAQFLEIMKGAKTIAEALEVQRQVSEVRTEIEQLEGRRRFLDHQSSLSTISVTLQPPQPIITTSSSGFAATIKHALGDSIEIAISIVTGLIRMLGVLLPIFLLIVAPCVFLLRFLFRRIRQRRQAQSV